MVWLARVIVEGEDCVAVDIRYRLFGMIDELWYVSSSLASSVIFFLVKSCVGSQFVCSKTTIRTDTLTLHRV